MVVALEAEHRDAFCFEQLREVAELRPSVDARKQRTDTCSPGRGSAE